MGRRVRRAPVVALVVSAGLLLGTGGSGPSMPAPLSFTPTARLESKLLTYPAGRAHPEGPDADEAPSRPRIVYSELATRLWSGRGRHPVWRGCRRVYDPELSKFIFSAAG